MEKETWIGSIINQFISLDLVIKNKLKKFGANRIPDTLAPNYKH